MIIYLILIYIGITISICGHEFFHCLVAKLEKIDVVRIVIGCEKYSIKHHKIVFSPIILQGYTEV